MLNLTITTERLILRPYRLSDAPALRVLADDVAVARMLTRLPHPYTQGDAERWIATHDALRARGTGYPFAIEKEGVLLGTISIERGGDGDFELGYWLEPGAWGQGFATEAVTAVLDFAFGWRALPYVRSRFISGNSASARVLAKTGFLATGRSRMFHAVWQAEVEVNHVILPRNAFAQDCELLTRSAA